VINTRSSPIDSGARVWHFSWIGSQDFARKPEQEPEFNLIFVGLTTSQQESNRSWSSTFFAETGAGVKLFGVGVESESKIRTPITFELRQQPDNE